MRGAPAGSRSGFSLVNRAEHVTSDGSLVDAFIADRRAAVALE
jgi:hypothetical protein